MKKILGILLSTILCIFISIPAFSLTASAAEADTMTLSFKETKDDKLRVYISVPAAKKLEVIDFSMSLAAKNAEIESFSLKNSGIEDSAVDFDDTKKFPKDKTFVYKTTESENELVFSGYFVDSLTTKKEFRLCTVTIAKNGDFSKKDTITFSYTLRGADGTYSGNKTYYPAKKDLNETTVTYANPMGDVNLDGAVNSDDARYILRAAVGLETPSLTEYPYADTNYDGTVSSDDARNALRTAVGLEESVMHRFRIILNGDKKSCTKGGTYTFLCELTGKAFTMDIKKGGHICPESACYNPGRCIVCNKKVRDATDHTYDKNGNCDICGANKKDLKAAKEKLLPLIEEIRTYDLLANDSLSNYKKADFLSFSQDAALSLRKAAEICDGIKGFEEVADTLTKAYKLRFDAFLSCMDKNGEILSDTANCTTIQNAVNLSYVYIDSLSYLK